RFGNDASGPDRVQKGILADDVLAVLHEVKQQIEDLRADRNDLGMPGQLTPVRVERIISKQILHLALRRLGSMGHRSGQALDITAGHRRGPAVRPAAKSRLDEYSRQIQRQNKITAKSFRPLTGKTSTIKTPARAVG